MESNSLGFVKHLDFADVTITLPSITIPASGSSEVVKPEVVNDATDDSDPCIARPLVSHENNPSVVELQQEAQRIREDLKGLDAFVSSFVHPFHQQAAEAESEDANVKQLKIKFSTLKSDSLELASKESFCQKLAEWQGEENEDGTWLSDESVTDVQHMRAQLRALKNSNADTIMQIESLINAIASDVNGLETDLSTASNYLSIEEDKLAEERSGAVLEDSNSECTSILTTQSDNPLDLEQTIRLLEEQLRQNERDYEDTEAEMKRRIEQYNLEMEELQAQANELDKEEESLRMLVDVSSRCLRKQQDFSNDMSVIAVGDERIELQLTTFVPSMDELETTSGEGRRAELEHKLYIKVNKETMQLEDAELIPGDVPIDDLLSAAQLKSSAYSSIEYVKDGELAEFGRQFAFLVRTVHNRINIFALKAASLLSASSDPRYNVEYFPEISVIYVTKPGKLKFLVEVPQGWPMQGCPLRLRSLHFLEDPESAANPGILQESMETANLLPEYARHDLLTFVQAVETIVSERPSQLTNG